MSSRIDGQHGSGFRQSGFEMPGSDIKKMGILKKLKTMKKKFFVLRSTSSSGPARLEYYDSEKKFRNGQAPKRSIHIHTCFNINKKSDSKHSFAIALYTKDDCFSMLAENQDEEDSWLELLLKYQYEYSQEQDKYEHYEHVWQVTIQPKGLGVSKNIRGNYRLCLSSQCISVVKVNCDKPLYKFQLATVRSLAHSDCLFRMEVGNWAPTGRGELWMNVEDAVIAKNMHEAILNCMKAAVDFEGLDELDRPDHGTMERNRSGSMTHGDWQTSVPRRNTFSDSRTHSPIRQRYCDRPVSVIMSKSAVDAVATGTSSCTDSSSEPGDKIDEEDVSETSSICSTPKDSSEKLRHDYDEDLSHASPYMDMTPGNVTPPTAATAPSGYVDMTPGSLSTSHDSGPAVPEENGSSYMNMSPGPPPPSEPIPIRIDTKSTGYMDMCPSVTSHSTPLPTVREGGSNEGYLPMSPSFEQSAIDTSNLRPTPAACLLTNDTSDFIKRTYSLGSKPPTKILGKAAVTHDFMAAKKGSIDNGKSCSAPHLLHKSRNLPMDYATSPSPLSASYKSDSSYRSDDSDSFMELDFHRPRTASDSYGCRPRASSFGKAYQGHRPRSSSYGQQAKPFKMKLASKLGSYESVRMTSQELMHRASLDSMSHGSRDSLRMSSNESLRKLSEELRTKTNLLNTEYVDMNIEKRKTPSPLPPTQQGGGYIDMTIGSRTASPSRGKMKESAAAVMTTSHSDEKVLQGTGSNHGGDDSYMNMDATDFLAKHHGKGDGDDGHSHHGSDDGHSHRGGGGGGHSHRGSDSHSHREAAQKAGDHSHSHHKDSHSVHHPVKVPTTTVHPAVESDYIGFEPGQIDSVSVSQSKRNDGSDSKSASKKSVSHFQQSRMSAAPAPSESGAGSKKGSSSSGRLAGGESRKSDLHGRPGTVPEQPEAYVMYEPKDVHENRDEYVMYEPKQSSSTSHVSDSHSVPRHGNSESLAHKNSQGVPRLSNNESLAHKNSQGMPRHGNSESLAHKNSQGVPRLSNSESLAHKNSQGVPRLGSSESLAHKSGQSASRLGNSESSSQHVGSKDPKKKRHSKWKRSSKVESDGSSPVDSGAARSPGSSGFAFRKTQQMEAASQVRTEEAADEYIEFSPMRNESSLKSVRQKKSNEDKERCKPKESVQSDYIGFEPGLVPASKESSKSPEAIKSMISMSAAEKKAALGLQQGVVSYNKSVPPSGGVKPTSRYSQPADSFFNFDFVKSDADDSNVQRYSDGRGCEQSDCSYSPRGSSKPDNAPSGVRITQCSNVPISGFVLAESSSSSSSAGKKLKESQNGNRAGKLVENRNEKPPHRHGSGGSSKGVVLSPKKILSVVSPKCVLAPSGDATSPKGVLVPTKEVSSGGVVSKSIVPSSKEMRVSSKGGVISKDITLSSDSVRVKHASGGSLKGNMSLKDEPVLPDSRCKHASGSSLSSDSVRSKHSSGGSAKGVVVSRDTSDVPLLSPSGILNTPPASAAVVTDTLDPGMAGMSRPGSTPCMLTLDDAEDKQTAGVTLTVDSNPRSRHSIADLSAYEKMSFTSNSLSTSTTTTTTQQQDGSQKVLNYASLDLGSAEAVGESDATLRSPRIKSRHPSSNEERAEPPLSYASIDFEKSESLKNAGSKDVKFTL
ncbi:uncharacterized protein LOC121377759 isoform X2 [Gigantopelta aegis]|uniref:uncharacterized protein LOC121377759 isoform X2 n=1 Tax=Gigantopelta aegis TaxID=1735272 RepID=UPI001B88B8F0|nr:uncharacterized protein LOC121377759 isoform X2 [Gigantopelta aegis]